MNIPNTLLNEFEGIDAYLKAACEIVRNGHMPDMQGLDARVSALCAAIGNAEPDLQQLCLSKLGELLKKLDACENDIRAFRNKQMKGHS